MSREYVHICDRCKREARIAVSEKVPVGWAQVEISILRDGGQFLTPPLDFGRGSLCYDCGLAYKAWWDSGKSVAPKGRPA